MSAPPDTAHPNAVPGAALYGVYRVLRALGEGASGRVFLAERTDFPQRVALKVFRPEFLTHGVANAGEARLLASLDHRHIVRVLQQGATPDGTRYLAMEYVEGEDIVAFCEAGGLPLAARIRLLLQALEGVAYAHRHLVLHGDLKPGNVLVAGSAGPAGEVKIVDFGSAVSLGDDAAAAAHTPEFASPEQRAGGRITVASDVYSLGLLARRVLKEVDPRRLRGDLEAILNKALQPRPEDRYPTAEAMAADLRAFAEGRTLAVRHASPAERLRKWVLRHKLRAAMAAVLASVLLFSAAGIAVKAAQARRSRRETQARLRELVQLTGTLQSELYGSVRTLPHAEASEKLLTDAAAATLEGLAASDATDPTLRAELADQYAQLARLEIEQAHAAGSAPMLFARAAEHLRHSLALAPANDAGDARVRLLQTLGGA